MSDGAARHARTASVALALGGALWGLIWLPLRWIAEAGLGGSWPGTLVFTAAALLLLPWIALRRTEIARRWRTLALTGLCLGTAFSFYAASLVLTEVVRAILLFYLMPVWGTLIGLAVLGERLTRPRIAALVLSLAGLLVVLDAGAGLPMPRNTGDVLALISGIAWSVGTAVLYRAERAATGDLMAAFVLGSLTVSAALLLPGGGPLPALPVVAAAAPAILFCAIYLLPMLALTLWPAALLTPGRVGLILMTEVVVAVISAATLSGEPLGPREIAGTVLIVTAALVEVLGVRSV